MSHHKDNWPLAATLRGEAVDLELAAYGIGGRIAIQAICNDTGEPYCTVTVNLPDEPLGEDEVFVKNYSENAGIAEELEAQGILRLTGRTVRSGYVEIPVAVLLK